MALAGRLFQRRTPGGKKIPCRHWWNNWDGTWNRCWCPLLDVPAPVRCRSAFNEVIVDPVHHFFLPLRLNLRGGHQMGLGIQVQNGGAGVGGSWIKRWLLKKVYKWRGGIRIDKRPEHLLYGETSCRLCSRSNLPRSQDQDLDRLLVKRRNDNHSPGPVIREISP